MVLVESQDRQVSLKGAFAPNMCVGLSIEKASRRWTQKETAKSAIALASEELGKATKPKYSNYVPHEGCIGIQEGIPGTELGRMGISTACRFCPARRT
jgi:hypothetical protein